LRLPVLQTLVIIDCVDCGTETSSPEVGDCCRMSVADMPDFVDELLNMAKKPDSFSKFELGEMILVAATEILKLREFDQPIDTGPQGNAKRRAQIQAR
jgi:hypothetical protein